MRFRLLPGGQMREEIERTRCTAVSSSGVDTPIMIHLGDENLISMHVHASIDVAGTKVLRAWPAVCLDPADRTWIGD